MPTYTVPRRITASKVMCHGARTPPTKRTVMAKLVTRMLELVGNSLVFLIAKITLMFDKTVNETMMVEMAIPSCSKTFHSKSQINSGAPGHKNFYREEFTSELTARVRG